MTSKTHTPPDGGSRWNRVPFYLLLITASILGAATFIEDARGTAYIHDVVYGALWFKILWGIVAVSALCLMWHRHLYKRVAVLALHLSLVFILAGGLTTALTHKTGMLHLRQGDTSLSFTDKDHQLHPLPFALSLDTFYIKNYPGTQAPQDYVSELGIGSEGSAATVSMNHILSREGYRFYQSSYDPDLLGTWLTVTYDPYGTPLAYFGFFLFGLSSVFVLWERRRSFTWQVRKSHSGNTLVPTLLSALLVVAAYIGWHKWGPSGTSPSPSIPAISRSAADSLSVRPVVWNDRLCPFNTLATDVVKKLYGKPRCKGYTPEQVVASWMLYPDVWNRAPIIKIKDAHLRRHLGLKDSYAAMVDLFDAHGQYRLQSLYARETDKNSKFSKAIRETDEKVGLVMMLLEGTLVQRPDSTAVPLSDTRVHAELLYNRIPFVSILFMANLTLGMLALALLIYFRLRGNDFPERFLTAARVLLHLSALVIATVYLLRWYISGRLPLSNGFETMMFVSLVILLLASWLARRTSAAVPFGFLLSGFTLLVAYLGLMNPQITSLMPVLNSPWLSSHVSIIMISYALLAFTFVMAIIGLATGDRTGEATQLSLQLLYPAVLLLGIGIFLGAVWANVSWGTYWSWDPKEVWALITLIIYALPLHRQSLPLFRHPRIYHIYLLFAFLTVLMTYFGVNFVLGGMHSYAN